SRVAFHRRRTDFQSVRHPADERILGRTDWNPSYMSSPSMGKSGTPKPFAASNGGVKSCRITVGNVVRMKSIASIALLGLLAIVAGDEFASAGEIHEAVSRGDVD